MKLFGHKKISEQQSTAILVQGILDGVIRNWPKGKAAIDEAFEKHPFQVDEEEIKFQLFYAILAAEMVAMKNSIGEEKEGSMRNRIFAQINKMDEEGQRFVNDYREAWERGIVSGEPPHMTVASRLYDNVGCTVSVEINNQLVKDPLMLTLLGGLISSHLGFWKIMDENYKIV